jgi:hypothetical protein
MNIRFDKCVSKKIDFIPRISFYWGRKLITIEWLKLPYLTIDIRKNVVADLMHGINQ